MNNRKAVWGGLVSVWVFLALGCSQPSEEAPRSLVEGQKRAMDKASAVEDQLKQAAEQKESMIDEQSR